MEIWREFDEIWIEIDQIKRWKRIKIVALKVIGEKRISAAVVLNIFAHVRYSESLLA